MALANRARMAVVPGDLLPLWTVRRSLCNPDLSSRSCRTTSASPRRDHAYSTPAQLAVPGLVATSHPAMDRVAPPPYPRSWMGPHGHGWSLRLVPGLLYAAGTSRTSQPGNHGGFLCLCSHPRVSVLPARTDWSRVDRAGDNCIFYALGGVDLATDVGSLAQAPSLPASG